MQRATRRFCILTGVALTAAALASCKAGHGADKSQVVARVNNSEITVSQLRAALAARGDMDPSEEAMRKALDGLVNEQLLVDAALRDKLDRDPVVVQAIETTRRQLLARAYLERTVFPRGEISAAEQTAYYKNHPELFAQRRVYEVTAFSFPRAKLDAGVVEAVGKAHSAEAVLAALAARKIEADTQPLVRAAEQLPLEQLPQFSAAAVGDVIVLQEEDDDRATLMLVTGVQSSPLSFVNAQPIIQQYLLNLRNAQAVDTHLKQVRAAAKITNTDTALAARTPTRPERSPPEAVRQSRSDQGAAVLN